jgi:hypothetical protein
VKVVTTDTENMGNQEEVNRDEEMMDAILMSLNGATSTTDSNIT